MIHVGSGSSCEQGSLYVRASIGGLHSRGIGELGETPVFVSCVSLS